VTWKREGDELVWTGREPYRHAVGDRAVLYYPGERLRAELAAELGIGATPQRPQARSEDKEE
jgi:hypothetical protein